nr:hypothetical protein [Tanacetum cinerariifolium]
MQNQTSNSLHNAIMEAGSKDRPPMLAPGNYIQWKSRIKPNRDLIHFCLTNPPYELGWIDKPILDAEGNPTTITQQVFETYKNVPQEIRDQLNAEAEAQHQHEVNEIRAEKIARVANPLTLVAQQHQVHHPQTHPIHFNQNSSIRTHQSATRKREKAVVNSPQPIYDQEHSMVDDDEDSSKDKEIDKLMALISLSFKKIYKPTNNNLRTSSNTSRANQDNSPWIYRNTGYKSQRSGTVAGARETVGSSMVQKSGIQCYNCKEYRHVARECQKPKRA